MIFVTDVLPCCASRCLSLVMDNQVVEKVVIYKSCICLAILSFLLSYISASEVAPVLLPCSSNPTTYGLPKCTSDVLGAVMERRNSRVEGPRDIEGQLPPILVDHIKLSTYPPDFAIIMSVHNHGRVIRRNIAAVLELTHGIWQLVVVLDDCTDNSMAEIEAAVKDHLLPYEALFQEIKPKQHVQDAWDCGLKHALRRGIAGDEAVALLRDNPNSNNSAHNGTKDSPLQIHSLLTEMSIIEQPSSVFETTSDNMGMSYACPSKYFILVQADMNILSPGWNLMLSRPTELFADVFSVSARCAHTFPGQVPFNAYGRCGEDVGQIPSAKWLAHAEHTVYLPGTVNRGPLLLQADRMEALGMLDERLCVLGDDDHDLMARACTEFGWRAAGYFAPSFFAPLSDGASRDHTESSAASKQFMKERHSRANSTARVERLRAAGNITKSEERTLSPLDIQHVTDFWRHRLEYALSCNTDSMAESSVKAYVT